MTTQVLPPLPAHANFENSHFFVALSGDAWISEAMRLFFKLNTLLGFAELPTPSDYKWATLKKWAQLHRKKTIRGKWKRRTSLPSKDSQQSYYIFSWYPEKEVEYSITFQHEEGDEDLFIYIPTVAGMFENHPAASKAVLEFIGKVLTSPKLPETDDDT